MKKSEAVENKQAYRALNGISHDPTNKTWAVGDLLYDGDLPAKTIEDLLESRDIEKVSDE